MILLSPLPGPVPAAVRIKKLLKIAGRSLGLRCVRVRSPTAAKALVLALARRVAAQSELLTRRAGCVRRQPVEVSPMSDDDDDDRRDGDGEPAGIGGPVPASDTGPAQVDGPQSTTGGIGSPLDRLGR